MPDFDLWYVLDGVGTVELNGVTQAVAAQTCFVFSPGSKVIAHHEPAQTAATPFHTGTIAVLCAGTTDIPVAEEAVVTAEIMGNSVKRYYDHIHCKCWMF